MPKFLNYHSISSRIYLLVGISLLAIATLLFVSLLTINQTRTDLRLAELVSVTSSTNAILEAQISHSKTEEISVEQAQAQALATIENIRYRGNEYFFIIDIDGNMIMHPFATNLVGENQLAMRDANGKQIFAEMIKIGQRDGAGFIDYVWPRGGSEQPVDKLTYVSHLESWGWIVGTGVYMDDIRAANAEFAMSKSWIVAIIVSILMLLAYFVGRTIARPVVGLTRTMSQLATGDTSLEVAGTARQDEIGEMARAVEVLKVQEETNRNAAAAEQRAMIAELQSAFGEVVENASRGDFSRRVENEFADPAPQKLATDINHLIGSVERGLSETGTVLGALAQTDLTKRVSGEFEGAFLKLKEDTNAVAQRLSEIVSGLKSTSSSLRTATNEILAGANDLSDRTTRQAATIEETSAAMEQLLDTVAMNAEKAQSATGRTNQVATLAAEGGEAMSKATVAMERITSSSSKISNIIGMIDDIAFQTNLLALNASVEAARAGEAGKGFAVVAVEVRRLAQSAADASSEVKALIEQSANEVADGTKLVSGASDKLEEMLSSVQENALLITDIASASEKQSSAISEVGAAVHQMDEMTQQNAAIAQTEVQANDLDKIVAVFRIGGGAKSAPKPTLAPQPVARAAAKNYARAGNAAISKDWSEF